MILIRLASGRRRPEHFHYGRDFEALCQIREAVLEEPLAAVESHAENGGAVNPDRSRVLRGLAQQKEGRGLKCPSRNS
jgi:hypothetical protein